MRRERAVCESGLSERYVVVILNADRLLVSLLWYCGAEVGSEKKVAREPDGVRGCLPVSDLFKRRLIDEVGLDVMRITFIRYEYCRWIKTSHL